MIRVLPILNPLCHLTVTAPPRGANLQRSLHSAFPYERSEIGYLGMEERLFLCQGPALKNFALLVIGELSPQATEGSNAKHWFVSPQATEGSNAKHWFVSPQATEGSNTECWFVSPQGD